MCYFWLKHVSLFTLSASTTRVVKVANIISVVMVGNCETKCVPCCAGDNCTKTDVECFLEEVMRMKGFQHRNVMTTIGLVLRDNRPFVVLPFMDKGDLKTYISDQTKVCLYRLIHRPNTRPLCQFDAIAQ